MLKCKICGHEFKPTANRHYICRENGKVGVIATFQSNPEDKLYDAFDCPECGCQHIAQERKRHFLPFPLAENTVEEKEGEEEA